MPSLSTTVEVTTTHEVKLQPQVKKKLTTSLRTYEDLALQREAIDLAMRKQKDTIEKVMADLGESSLKLDGFTATIVSQVRKKLDQKKLIALGVSVDVIDKATVESPTKPYLKVTTPRGMENRGEDRGE